MSHDNDAGLQSVNGVRQIQNGILADNGLGSVVVLRKTGPA